MASLTLLTTSSPSASTQNAQFLLSATNSNNNNTTQLNNSTTKIAPKRDACNATTTSSSSRSRRNRPSAATTQSGRGGPSVARRNERERNRVRQVNLGFATLRQHVPNRSKKMSKVETLRSAVTYIRQLQQLLGDESTEDAENCCSMPGFAEAFAGTLMPRHSTGGASASSPAPSLGSDDAGSSPYDNSLSPEDEELMDFASWLS